MERMELTDINTVIYHEHIHRYIHAIDIIEGKVLDVACGIGYSYEILKQRDIEYYGLDINENAINIAKKQSKDSKKFFYKTGSILDIQHNDNTFNTVISFETLEHLYDYKQAISEIKRVMKEDGIFIGSVPSEEFDNKCESVYGKNEYHVTRFSLTKLKNLLKDNFNHSLVFSNTLDIVSNFVNIDVSDNIFNCDNNMNKPICGSMFFIASNDEKKFKTKTKLIKNSHYFIAHLVNYDEQKSKPLYQTIESQTLMIDERDKTIESQTLMIDERDYYIKKLENKLDKN